jgi:hypothetical protein
MYYIYNVFYISSQLEVPRSNYFLPHVLFIYLYIHIMNILLLFYHISILFPNSNYYIVLVYYSII